MTQRAGIIPYFIDDNGNVLMYFMKPSDPKYGGPHFQIAKGKVDEGEEIEDAAFREAYEELGLKSTNIESHFLIGDHYFNFTHAIYAAKITCSMDFDEPHYETGDTKWCTFEEYSTVGVGRDIHIPIIRDALEQIMLLEDL